MTRQSNVTDLLADLAANGGSFEPQPDQADGLPRFLLHFASGADRVRCRKIVAEIKASPAKLRAAIEVARKAGRAAA